MPQNGPQHWPHWLQILGNATVIAGYRAAGLNYENGNGRDNFKANTTLHGPVAGLEFTF